MAVHRTLPIPQVIPDASGQADDEPGIGPVPHPNPKVLRKMARKPAFRTPVFVRPQSERGIFSGMNHKAEQLHVNVPLPVRSSLAQGIGVFKVQTSHYIYLLARATRWPGMPGTSYSTSHYPSFSGYPTAKVHSMVNTAPQMRAGYNKGQTRGRAGFPARSGFMNAPPRFRKALPSPVNDYQPPIYGQ